MGLSVVTVEGGKARRDFLNLPFVIYANDANWVSPLRSEVLRTLDSSKNPYFAEGLCRLFVCYRDRKPVARVALIINRRHWRAFSVRAAFFGFFESHDDAEAVRLMFDAAAACAACEGAEVLEGPFNPHHYSEIGLQLTGYDEPQGFFQTHNPPYYRELLESCGFHLAKVIHTRKNGNIREQLFRMRQVNRHSQAFKDYVCRPFDMKNFRTDLETVRLISNDAFSSNWHFLPLTQEEYRFTAKYLRLVTSPELFKIVEYRDQPVAVLECVPDVNPMLKQMHGRAGLLKYLRFLKDRRKARTLVVYAVGIRRAFKGSRAFLVLFDALRAMAAAYDELETTWISDENRLILRAAEYFGLEEDKQFGVFEKSLDRSAHHEHQAA